jgi:FkbM family methyltransferase
VVVDLGCVSHDRADSLAVLAELYEPDHMYGFDPYPALDESVKSIEGVPVTLRRKAAWVFDGVVSFHIDGWASRMNGSGVHVPCFDFSRWLKRLRAGYLVVKMDIEGAEVPILEKMDLDGTIELVDELLVEWHGQELPVEVTQWWL